MEADLLTQINIEGGSVEISLTAVAAIAWRVPSWVHVITTTDLAVFSIVSVSRPKPGRPLPIAFAVS